MFQATTCWNLERKCPYIFFYNKNTQYCKSSSTGKKMDIEENTLLNLSELFQIQRIEWMIAVLCQMSIVLAIYISWREQVIFDEMTSRWCLLCTKPTHLVGILSYYSTERDIYIYNALFWFQSGVNESKIYHILGENTDRYTIYEVQSLDKIFPLNWFQMNIKTMHHTVYLKLKIKSSNSINKK